MKGKRWTRAADEQLVALVELHLPYAKIGMKLGRSAKAVQAEANRLGCTLKSAADCRSLEAVGRLLGLNRDVVYRWRDSRYITVHRVGKTAKLVDDGDLMTFLADERYWHEWWPERITDPDWREWATEQRRGLTFLRSTAVGHELGLHYAHVSRRIRDGHLKAVWHPRWGWLVRSDWLEEGRRYVPPLGGNHPNRLLSADDEAFIREWRPVQPLCHVAAALDRADGTILAACRRLGVDGPSIERSGRRWGRTWRRGPVEGRAA